MGLVAANHGGEYMVYTRRQDVIACHHITVGGGRYRRVYATEVPYQTTDLIYKLYIT